MRGWFSDIAEEQAESRSSRLVCSRLRVWWLVTYRGYRVVRLVEEPKAGVFGHVKVVKRFLIEPPS